jgi:hypothetical protein
LKTVWRPGSVACVPDGIINGVLADKGWLLCADQDRSLSVKAAQIRKGSRRCYAGRIMADRVAARIAALAAQLAALSKNEI